MTKCAVPRLVVFAPTGLKTPTGYAWVVNDPNKPVLKPVYTWVAKGVAK